MAFGKYGEREMTTEFWWGKLKEGDRLFELDVVMGNNVRVYYK
jgi:hypothetical protein